MSALIVVFARRPIKSLKFGKISVALFSGILISITSVGVITSPRLILLLIAATFTSLMVRFSNMFAWDFLFQSELETF